MGTEIESGGISVADPKMDISNPFDLSMARLAALAALLHRRDGASEVRVRAVMPGFPDDTPVVTVSVEVDGELTFAELVRRLGGLVASAPPQAYPEEETGPIAELRGGPDWHHDRDVRVQVQVALAAGLADPELRVGEMPFLAPEEEARLRSWGGTGRQSLPSRRVEELVFAQAAATPDAPALTGIGTRYTYRELVIASEDVATRLKARGVGPDEVVGVLMERSAGLVVVLLGILRAGAAYFAVNADEDPSHAAKLLDAAGVRLLAVDETTARTSPTGFELWNTADDLAADHSGHGMPTCVPGTEAESEEGADRLAYVAFTSGSTGEPRPVAVPHRAVSRLVRAPDWIELRASDVVLQHSPVAFDASTFEIWAPLTRGARLAIAPAGRLDLADLADFLQQEGVTVAWFTAGLFHGLVADHLHSLGGLRHLLAGGDVVMPGAVQDLLRAHPGTLFTNGYGPTENTTFTACWTSRTPPRDTVPIGRPIDGTRVLVLDSAMRFVPVGVRGELYAAGDGLSDGYLGHPRATAERFVNVPFGDEGIVRLYRTGDVARWRSDGDLEFLGRVDAQVKVQGFRVEPGAVEAALMRHPEVSQAAVVAQRLKSGDTQLVAYVVPVNDEPASDLGTRLRQSLLGGLPSASVPRAVLLRRDLPLSRNGKVDRGALPAATCVPRNVWNEYVPPATELESQLAELWGAVLGVEPIGVEDDFFDLGGHSLLASRLIVAVQERFDAELSARVLYTQPTVRELCENLRAQKGIAQGSTS
ncbi:amino acid adenylation domain-containing protein [Streptomyces sp. NPDC008163]|uniref:amino acid adenylation domain-containing protein n=1 Tax=Streptomyces sp. NPDC008163 TaxID=3364818 RepID=UPI0036E72F24